MTLILEMTITIILLFTGNKIGEYFNDSLYEVFLQNGEHVKIKTTISNIYKCPNYCGISHYHNVIINDKLSKDKYVIDYKKINNSIMIKGQEVKTIYEIKVDKYKNKKKEVNKVQIKTENFIKKLIFKTMYRGWDSNPHSLKEPDFESGVSTNFTTSA